MIEEISSSSEFLATANTVAGNEGSNLFQVIFWLLIVFIIIHIISKSAEHPQYSPLPNESWNDLGVVYLLRSTGNWYKIGRHAGKQKDGEDKPINFTQRLEQYKTHNPYVEVIKVIQANKNCDIEGDLIKLVKDKKHKFVERDEWFWLMPVEVSRVVEAMNKASIEGKAI